MGNNNIASECCSYRKDRENMMMSRFDRQDLYKSPNKSVSTPQLENSMLDPLRKTYDKNFMTEVEKTLNLRKSKGKSILSEANCTNNNPRRKLLSERSACGSSTFGDCEKIKMIKIDRPITLIKHLRNDDYSNPDMVFLANFVLPNPLSHLTETFVFFQNINDVKNLNLPKKTEIHEYNEFRFKIQSDDLDKEKKFTINYINSVSENHEFIGNFINEKMEYVLVFHKKKISQKSPNNTTCFLLECLNNSPLSTKYLEESISSARAKNMEFKGAFLLYLHEKKYSWLLIYKKNSPTTKNYLVASIDQLNLKLEISKNSLARKIENLTEIDVIF